MNSQLSPVVIFVYNRLQHTKRLLSSLEQSDLCHRTKLFIFADAKGARTKAADVEEVQNFVKNYQNNSPFQKVSVAIAKEHKGLANSVISGVSGIIKRYKKVIVLEDDLIVSQDFLQFMNDALDFYQDNKRIWSIAGHTPQLAALKSYPQDIYLSFRASSWGWATWEDRWRTVDWRVREYAFFRHNLIEQLLFNRGGNDLSLMLANQMEGKIDSWAIRWCYAQSRQNKYTVYPAVTKVENCGLDGTGTNCCRRKTTGETAPSSQRCTIKQVSLDKKVLREFKRYYGPDNILWIIHFFKIDYLIEILKG